MMTDPIADMLTRLRNANTAFHDEVLMPSSKQKEALARILEREGYITGVEVAIDGQHVTVTGPKGTLEHDLPETISVAREGEELLVTRPDDERQNRALHGLTRSLVANMVTGVSTGFTRELEIVGVGYRAI